MNIFQEYLSEINLLKPSLYDYSYDPLSRRTRRDIVANKTLRTDYHYDSANRLLSLANKTIGKKDEPSQEIPFARGLSNWLELFVKLQIPINKFQTIYNNQYTMTKTTNEQRGLEIVNCNLGFVCNLDFVYCNLSSFFDTPAYAAEPDMQLVSSFNYTYDNVGNRLIRQTQGTQQTQETYGYDDIYQLTSVSGDQAHSYDYDAVGNREVVDATSYTANNLNQYTDVGGSTYSYDQNGNLTNDGTNAYTYDFENRLIGVEYPGSSIEYQYDAFGRRISKTVDAVTTYFIYDGDQVIEERDYNGSLAKRFTYGTGIDEPIRYTNHESQATTYYYFSDGLGSTTELLNPNGAVVESYSYDVYGAPSQISSVGNPYYFTGRRLDEEANLYYYRARYYSPSIGRFLQRDPWTWGPDDEKIFLINTLNNRLLALQPLINSDLTNITSPIAQRLSDLILDTGQSYPTLFHPYLYVYNNPVNYLDPSGKVAISTVIIIISGALAARLIYQIYQCASWSGKAMDKAREIRARLESKARCGIVSEDEVAREFFKTEEWKKAINYCGCAAVGSYTIP